MNTVFERRRHSPSSLHEGPAFQREDDVFEETSYSYYRQIIQTTVLSHIWGRTNGKPVCNSLHEIRMMGRPYSPGEVDQELKIQYGVGLLS
jgi:hypothetical protein